MTEQDQDPDDGAVPDDQSPASYGDTEEIPEETEDYSDEDMDPGFNDDEPSGHRDHAEVQQTGPTAEDVTGVHREPPETGGQVIQEGSR